MSEFEFTEITGLTREQAELIVADMASRMTLHRRRLDDQEYGMAYEFEVEEVAPDNLTLRHRQTIKSGARQGDVTRSCAEMWLVAQSGVSDEEAEARALSEHPRRSYQPSSARSALRVASPGLELLRGHDPVLLPLALAACRAAVGSTDDLTRARHAASRGLREAIQVRPGATVPDGFDFDWVVERIIRPTIEQKTIAEFVEETTNRLDALELRMARLTPKVDCDVHIRGHHPLAGKRFA